MQPVLHWTEKTLDLVKIAIVLKRLHHLAPLKGSPWIAAGIKREPGSHLRRTLKAKCLTDLYAGNGQADVPAKHTNAMAVEKRTMRALRATGETTIIFQRSDGDGEKSGRAQA